MGAFTVPDQTARNKKVGYGHIRTGHQKRNSERILEIADFSLFGVSAPLWSAEVAPNHKGFDNQYYRDMIIDYLRKFGKAQRKDIRKLLWDKLPDVLDDAQKDRKILTLLTALKRAGRITTDSDNKQTSHWILVD